MSCIDNLTQSRVFHYFKEISGIPRGSGNTKGIADFCENFAKSLNLKYIRDSLNNVIIFKPATPDYENTEPVILQGHLDMVCQKTENCDIDFEKYGIDLYIDGDFIKAHGTTLGADNGIAVATVLAILESNTLKHPPIEAVFTVDEEVGMLGAMALDMSVLKGKRMINLDSEEEDTLTVSCAGGGDFTVNMPITYEKKSGIAVTLAVKGLKGGHSGVEINSGRVNANLLTGRILDSVKNDCNFDIISINGGDKSNAIPNRCTVKLCVCDTVSFKASTKKIFDIIKKEIAHREENFNIELSFENQGEYDVFSTETRDKLILTLLCVPNGVIEMSAEIENLVETSLNLGILKTDGEKIELGFSLRSNKKSAQTFLERRLGAFFTSIGLGYEKAGFYPPWEFKSNSPLQELYCEIYEKHYGKKPIVAAIHAGLECGVFSSAIDNLDCISVGPAMYDVHTTDEKLSISSTERLYSILTDMLEKMKG